MFRRAFATVTRPLFRQPNEHSPPPAPDLAESGHRFDRLSQSLATAPSRRSALRLVASAALAALVTWRGIGEADANQAFKNARKKCRKLKRKAARRRCLDRARRKYRRRPNASCIVPTNQSIGGAAGLLRAQTFTEPNGGRLKFARIMMWKGTATSGDLRVSLNAVTQATGVPQHNTIAVSAPVQITAIGTTPALVTFEFPFSPKLVAKRKYALVLAWSGADTSGSQFYRVSWKTPGPCAGGESYVSQSGAPFTVPAQGRSDMLYTTVVTA